MGIFLIAEIGINHNMVSIIKGDGVKRITDKEKVIRKKLRVEVK